MTRHNLMWSGLLRLIHVPMPDGRYIRKMSWILIICGLVGAYCILNLLGGERQRCLCELEARYRKSDKTELPSHEVPIAVSSLPSPPEGLQKVAAGASNGKPPVAAKPVR